MNFRSAWLTALLFGVLTAGAARAASPPEITAKSAVLFDAKTGRVLYKKNENLKMPIASTQKLLTALLVAERGNLDGRVTIAKTDTYAEPTKLYLQPGQTYTRRELLTALLIKSPNDVAKALARDHSGSSTAFARAMNQRMERLGGKSSHFVNPNGLPAEGQYSTARDIARVARTVYRNPLLRDIMNTRYHTFRYSNGKKLTLKNTNRVLRTYSFCNGMKTGYTRASGHCLVSSGSYGGRDVIAVVLGSNKAKVWPESTALLAYGLGLSDSDLARLRRDSAQVSR